MVVNYFTPVITTTLKKITENNYKYNYLWINYGLNALGYSVPSNPQKCLRVVQYHDNNIIMIKYAIII